MTPHEHNAQSRGSSPAETQQDTGKNEPSNTGSTQQCTPDYMSAATGAIPIVSPGADAIASATIEDESGRRIQLTKADETEGAPPETPAKTRIPTGLKVLIAASFMIALGYGLVAPVLPSFARSFNVGVAATTIVVSALAAMRLVFAPGAGKLISRFGERPIYTCGMVIVAVSSFVNAAAWDYWVLLASRAFAGIGSVMFTVSAMGLLVRLAPSHMRGRVSGYYATAFLLGNIMGPVVGGACHSPSTAALCWWLGLSCGLCCPRQIRSMLNVRRTVFPPRMMLPPALHLMPTSPVRPVLLQPMHQLQAGIPHRVRSRLSRKPPHQPL